MAGFLCGATTADGRAAAGAGAGAGVGALATFGIIGWSNVDCPVLRLQ